VKVSVLGFVSALSTYYSKKEEAEVDMISVACGGHMLNVRCPDDQSFQEMDMVVVQGELRPNGREFYIKAAAIRTATVDDLAFFRKEVPDDGNGEVVGSAAKKSPSSAPSSAPSAGGGKVDG